MIKLVAFVGDEELHRVGEIHISYDRIVSLSLRFPKFLHIKRNKAKNNKMVEPSKSIEINKSDIAYPYTIEELSKADFAYRDYKLTHQVLSEELTSLISCKLFIRLTLFQWLRIMYNSKKFFWQTKEFKKTVYNSLGKQIVWGLVSIAGFLAIVLFTSPSKNAHENIPFFKSGQGTVDTNKINTLNRQQ